MIEEYHLSAAASLLVGSFSLSRGNFSVFYEKQVCTVHNLSYLFSNVGAREISVHINLILSLPDSGLFAGKGTYEAGCENEVRFVYI